MFLVFFNFFHERKVFLKKEGDTLDQGVKGYQAMHDQAENKALLKLRIGCTLQNTELCASHQRKKDPRRIRKGSKSNKKKGRVSEGERDK